MQVYTVVCGVSVGIMNACWNSDGIGVTAVSLLYHCAVGTGVPVAIQ